MNILDKIIEHKRIEVAESKAAVPVAELERRPLFTRQVLSLRASLTDPRKTTEARAQQLLHTAKPIYYAISAQLQGGGDVSCKIEVDGHVISSGQATGGYNIAQCEIGQDPITGDWQNDNG